jgi:N6-adenosine-specific RNA methylase IME4
MLMKVADVIVGKRHRKDMGDIAELAKNVEAVGLLQPIVLTSDNRLIAGERRLEAFKLLGKKYISATVVDLDEIVAGEFAENVHRKDFTLSEAVAIKRALEPIEKAAAKERQREGARRGGRASGKLPEASKGNAADKAAKAAGMARRTLEKAEAVVAAAEAEPEKFNKLVADMDRTGLVSGPFKRLKILRQAEVIRGEPPPLPGNGPYRVIVADPPWPYEKRSEDPSHRATYPYPQMSIRQICDTNVASLAHEDCVLLLWVTNHHMREAFNVLDAWGFEQKTILTWAKDRMGAGDWLRGQTEHCLMTVRGKPVVEIKSHSTLLLAPRRAHSEKPDEFYSLVESLCPAPRYAYLWSRMAREKWDGHGDEYPGHRLPDVEALADVIDQLPRVAAEVDTDTDNRPSVRPDHLDIPTFLDRRRTSGGGGTS